MIRQGGQVREIEVRRKGRLRPIDPTADPNHPHTQVLSKNHIRSTVSDHEALAEVYFGEFVPGLLGQPGLGFSTITAFGRQMRTIIDTIHPCSSLPQFLQKKPMDPMEIFLRHQAFAYALLIGHYDHAVKPAVEIPNGSDHPG